MVKLLQSVRESQDGTSFEALVIRMSNELWYLPCSRPKAPWSLGVGAESPTHHLHIAILYRYQLEIGKFAVDCLAI